MTTCLLAVLLAAAACDKEKLYASYRFVCDVDGKKWVLGDRSPLDVYLVGDTVFTITATAGSSSTSMFIKDKGGIRLGNYVLDGGAYGDADHRGSQQYDFTTDPSHTGTLTITGFDRTTFRASGRFNFRGINPSTGRSVNITNGFFNATYYPR